MKDHLYPRDLHNLVKGIWLRDVGHNDESQLVVRLIWIGVADLSCLLRGPDRCDHGVSLLKKLLEDMSCVG